MKTGMGMQEGGGIDGDGDVGGRREEGLRLRKRPQRSQGLKAVEIKSFYSSLPNACDTWSSSSARNISDLG
jgi:hypothetical protein